VPIRRTPVLASEITQGSLAPALTMVAVCRHCDSVVDAWGMTEIGKPCPVCGTAWREGAIGYFPLSVHALIELIQQAYHSQAHRVRPVDPADERPAATGLAALVFYCTLGEVLLEHFLTRVMNKQGVPRRLQDQLLEVNLSFRLRMTRLFPAVTGDTWDAALRTLRERQQSDYRPVSKFHQEAVNARNLLLHQGNKWSVPTRLPKQCVDNMPVLIHLFVALHNLYVADSADEFIPVRETQGRRQNKGTRTQEVET